MGGREPQDKRAPEVAWASCPWLEFLPFWPHGHPAHGLPGIAAFQRGGSSRRAIRPARTLRWHRISFPRSPVGMHIRFGSRSHGPRGNAYPVGQGRQSWRGATVLSPHAGAREQGSGPSNGLFCPFRALEKYVTRLFPGRCPGLESCGLSGRSLAIPGRRRPARRLRWHGHPCPWSSWDRRAPAWRLGAMDDMDGTDIPPAEFPVVLYVVLVLSVLCFVRMF